MSLTWLEHGFVAETLAELLDARPQVFHLMTKTERAESEDAIVEIATLEATVLNDRASNRFD